MATMAETKAAERFIGLRRLKENEKKPISLPVIFNFQLGDGQQSTDKNIFSLFKNNNFFNCCSFFLFQKIRFKI
jgi:hypothetical protein